MSKTTWGLAASGARARIACNLMSDCPQVVEWDANKRAGVVHDQPGRVVLSAALQRRGLELHADPLRASEREFAAKLAAFLLRECEGRAFDSLIVSAAPRTLGDLRAVFAANLSRHVVAEIDRDYTLLPDRELIHALRTLLPE